MIKKNIVIYVLLIVLLVLGIVYFTIPTKDIKKQDTHKIEIKQQENKKENKNIEQKKQKLNVSEIDLQNYEFLNNKIVMLTKQIEILKKNSPKEIKAEFEKIYLDLDKIKIKNEQLKLENNSLNQRIKQEILSANEKSKISYEEKITKINEQLSNYKTQIDELTKNLNEKEKTINNLNSTIDTLKNEKQASIVEKDNLLKKTQDELDLLNTTLEDKNKNLLNITNENNNLKAQIENMHKLEKENSELNTKNINLEKEIKTLQALNKTDENNKNQDLLTKINEINSVVENLTKENEQLNNKIKLTNELEKEKNELKDKLFRTKLELEEYKNTRKSINSDSNFNEVKKSYDELNIKFLELQEKLNAKELESNKYKEDSLKLEKIVAEFKTSDNNYEKIANLELEKNNLLQELNNLKTSNTQTNQTIKPQTLYDNEKLNTQNIKLLDSMICDDIKSGETTLSQACYLKLDEFLNKYNKNLLYEITPIIDGGGFKSLNAVDGIHISTKEVQRLTRLANFGLSKDRTKSAASYIKSKIPNALISSSLEPEYSKDNKKGFILRVYK